MNSFSILFIFVAIVVLALLALNFHLAPRNPYFEKLSVFECGFHSFSQTRSQFHLSFFMYAIIYLILDLELVLLYPYALSTYENGIYGLVIMLIFTTVITIGFIYELGSGALEIDSRQNSSISSSQLQNPHLIKSSCIPSFIGIRSLIPLRKYNSLSNFSLCRSVSTNSNKNYSNKSIHRTCLQKLTPLS